MVSDEESDLTLSEAQGRVASLKNSDAPNVEDGAIDTTRK